MKNLTETPHGRRAADIRLAASYLLSQRARVADSIELLAEAARMAAMDNGNKPTVERLQRLASEFTLLANMIRN